MSQSARVSRAPSQSPAGTTQRLEKEAGETVYDLPVLGPADATEARAVRAKREMALKDAMVCVCVWVFVGVLEKRGCENRCK